MTDHEYEKRLFAAITEAIVNTSKDPTLGVPVLKLGETSGALTTALAAILVMSAEASSSPTRIRQTADQIAKRLQRSITAMRAEASDLRAYPDFAAAHGEDASRAQH